MNFNEKKNRLKTRKKYRSSFIGKRSCLGIFRISLTNFPMPNLSFLGGLILVEVGSQISREEVKKIIKKFSPSRGSMRKISHKKLSAS